MWRVLKRCEGSELISVSGRVAVLVIFGLVIFGLVIFGLVIFGIDLLSRGVQVSALASANSTPPLSPTAPELPWRARS